MPHQGRRPLRRARAAGPHGRGGLRRCRLHRAALPAARASGGLHHAAVRGAGGLATPGHRPGGADCHCAPRSGRAAGRSALRQGTEVRGRGSFRLLPGRTAGRGQASPGALRRSRPRRARLRRPQGGQLRRSNFRDDWVKARKAAGVTAELHFHDLRHTGNTLASTAGASTRELMTRMGHSSSRAALIYQHMTSDRDRAIADRLGVMIRGGGGVASRSPGEDPERT
ncbi:tyrosine-type recombinase/integrase [Streptomyces sp. NPDC006458]|uniref:tyrosine-type recombinase/integrase n=1 Tax=Streptomyces sp. NPDC006458 TaxID=3154302 RepID=UPI00339E96F9